MSALEHECPRCHSLAGVECCECAPTSAQLRPVAPHPERLELERDQVKGTPAQLVPMNQQLDAAGELHDIAPRHERSRLFAPAPEQMPGQLGLGLDG